MVIGLPGAMVLGELAANSATRDRGLALHEQVVALSILVADAVFERQRDLDFLAGSRIMQEGALDSAAVVDLLDSLENTLPEKSLLMVADLEGQVLASNDNRVRGTRVGQQLWFQRGQLSDYVGTHLHQPTGQESLPGGWFIDISTPIRDPDGTPRGVLSLHLAWEWIGGVLRQISSRDPHLLGMEAFLVNSQNQVLYPVNWKSDPFPQQLYPPADLFALITWENDIRYLVASQPVQKYASLGALGWKVVAREPAQSALQPVVELQRNLLLVGLALVALIGLGTISMAARFSRPIRQLVEMARQVEAGTDRVPDAPISQIEEVNELSQALQTMTMSLLQRKEELATINASLEQKVEERTQELAHLNQALHQQASQDFLTGLYNRWAARDRLTLEWQKFLDTGRQFAVIVSDIDHFKKINDQYGHEMGDRVLISVARALRNALRPHDFLARYGGEEFLFILPNTTLNQATQVAERLRLQVSQTRVDGAPPVTLSLGVAVSSTEQSSEELVVQIADRQLYRAKHQGRNQVVASSSDTLA